jgi:prolipoprotein diacylglyceryl transferase
MILINNSFNLFGISIAFYSVTMLLGIMTCWIYVKEKVVRGQKKWANHFENFALWVVIWGIVGARIWYAIANYHQFSNILEVLAIWNGGIAIQGAIVFGTIAGVIYFQKFAPPFSKIAIFDHLFPIILVGQAIGRWGNFFNQEVYGNNISLTTTSWLVNLLFFLWAALMIIILACSQPWIIFTKKKTLAPHRFKYQSFKFVALIAVFFLLISTYLGGFNNSIITGMKIHGLYRLPLFLIEGVLNLASFILITRVISKVVNFPGLKGALYFVFYGAIRATLEPFRNSNDIMKIGGIYVSVVLSLLFLLFGLFLVISFHRKNRFVQKVFDVEGEA